MSTNKIALRKEQVQLLENLAVQIEKSGLQPATAKIMALLLVSDNPELTFDEIRETLGISKSAASTALNHLLTINKIEYKSKIGDRKRYFCSRLTSWQEDVRAQMEGVSSFSSVLKSILAQRPSKTADFNSSLKNLIAFMDFLSDELPALYEKFEKRRT